jgi:hypothetical protein
MIPTRPACEECKRLKVSGDLDTPLSCEAFPSGIPDDIYFYGNPHTEPYPGDNGLQFLSVVKAGAGSFQKQS